MLSTDNPKSARDADQRAYWEWIHEAPDPDRWDDAPVLLAYPPDHTAEVKPHDAHVLDWVRARRGDYAGNEEHLLLDPTNPIKSARALLDARYIDWNNDSYRELKKLYRHRGSFWQWTGSHYRLADDEIMRSELWTFMEQAMQRIGKFEVPFKPNNARVTDAIAALNAITQLDQYIEAPAWLTAGTTDAIGWLHLPNGVVLYLPPANECLACGNGLLHLPTGELFDPTPDYFNTSASTVVYDLYAPAPVQWLTFLDQVFEDDTEAKELLQELFGYALSPDTSQQKIALFVGDKRSGKGTIGRVLTALLGKDSVGAPTMSGLAQAFGLESLITKPLAIISDARIGARTDKSAIVERLLSISGEDSVTVPRKYKNDWTGRLPTRFMILTNLLPSLSDDSGALPSRFIILVMTKSFYGKEDLALTSKLLTELPGILNWAIEGYRRLRERGHFVQPDSSKQAAEDIEMLAAPVKAFVRDCCDVGPGLKYVSDDTWEDWKTWCEDQGRDFGNKPWFGRNLQSAVPGLKVTRPLGEFGNRPYTYVGIGPKPPPLRPDMGNNENP